MVPHLSGFKRLLVPMIRPKMTVPRTAKVLDFHKALAAQPKDALTFEESEDDRFCAMFHTGGTTGSPKLAQHRFSGAMFNAWANADNLFTPEDVVLCRCRCSTSWQSTHVDGVNHVRRAHGADHPAASR